MFFESVNKMDKPMVKLTKKRENPNKVRNEKVKISTNNVERQTIREYHEQLYANKFDNLEEMDNSLETYSPPKLNQEEINQEFPSWRSG